MHTLLRSGGEPTVASAVTVAAVVAWRFLRSLRVRAPQGPAVHARPPALIRRLWLNYFRGRLNSNATGIVLVTLLRTAVDTAIV